MAGTSATRSSATSSYSLAEFAQKNPLKVASPAPIHTGTGSAREAAGGKSSTTPGRCKGKQSQSDAGNVNDDDHHPSTGRRKTHSSFQSEDDCI